MNIREVRFGHYITLPSGYKQLPDKPPVKKLPRQAVNFYNRWDLGESEFAMVATKNRRLVAFFRFSIDFGNELRTLVPGGTWVRANYRNKGIARELWRRAIRKHVPEEVSVVVVSKGGHRLVLSLESLFPHIHFDVTTAWPVRLEK
jgi:GNAT superfamily N-acetyltransferase